MSARRWQGYTQRHLRRTQGVVAEEGDGRHSHGAKGNIVPRFQLSARVGWAGNVRLPFEDEVTRLIGVEGRDRRDELRRSGVEVARAADELRVSCA